MINYNHKTITELGLENSGLTADAIEFIKSANADSDESASGDAAYAPQHFQRGARDSATTESVVKGCEQFYKNAISKALEYASKEDCQLFALYCLGRALHCIQDFYAHSNWVAITTAPSPLYELGQLYGPGPERVTVKLCKLTPETRQFDNIINFQRSVLFKKKKWFEDYVKSMKEEELDHPDVHLDVLYSAASVALEKAGPHLEYGYWTAKDLAKRHTEKAWADFEKELKGNALAFKRYKPDPWNCNLVYGVQSHCRQLFQHQTGGDRAPKKFVQSVAEQEIIWLETNRPKTKKRLHLGSPALPGFVWVG